MQTNRFPHPKAARPPWIKPFALTSLKFVAAARAMTATGLFGDDYKPVSLRCRLELFFPGPLAISTSSASAS